MARVDALRADNKDAQTALDPGLRDGNQVARSRSDLGRVDVVN
jgi:hypothetical protein